jgi:hypothetical protein
MMSRNNPYVSSGRASRKEKAAKSAELGYAAGKIRAQLNIKKQREASIARFNELVDKKVEKKHVKDEQS